MGSPSDPDATQAEAAGLEETRRASGRARGLLSGRRSGSRIDVGRRPPPASLAGAVDQLWWGAWDLRGQAPHTTELLATPAVNVVFETDQGRVVGAWTRLWTRRLEGRGAVRGARLLPGAARAVLGVDAAELADRRVPLDRFDPDPNLVAAVLGPDDPEQGLDALEAWLERRWRPDPEARRAVRAVQRLESGAVLRVDELAAELGLSVRALQRLFRRHVGIAPKAVIRRVRLREVAARVEDGLAPNLADLAAELGYADQAHLARDFRSATGRTLRGFEAAVHET